MRVADPQAEMAVMIATHFIVPLLLFI